MKISNFKLINTVGHDCLTWVYYAVVDVETGFLLWKKKETRPIFRSYTGSWRFLHDGKLTPGFIVEELEKAEEAKNKIKEHENA